MTKICVAMMVVGGVLGYAGYGSGDQNLMFVAAVIGLSGVAGVDRLVRFSGY